MGTLKPHSNGLLYTNMVGLGYTGRYTWCSKEGPTPSPLFTVPNVTAHPSMATNVILFDVALQIPLHSGLTASIFNRQAAGPAVIQQVTVSSLMKGIGTDTGQYGYTSKGRKSFDVGALLHLYLCTLRDGLSIQNTSSLNESKFVARDQHIITTSFHHSRWLLTSRQVIILYRWFPHT